MQSSTYDIPYYLDYLPASVLQALWQSHQSCPEVPGLRIAPGLRKEFPEIETSEALQLICQVYRNMRAQLQVILQQRVSDRAFIDRQTLALQAENQSVAFQSADYQTVIGMPDEQGKIIIGPLSNLPEELPQVEVPAFLEGDQVTLFGPPDTAKMSINAMNTWHRKLPNESQIVADLVEQSGQVPRWGADNEDSKTPIMRNFLRACKNLIGCFDGSLSFVDSRRNKSYALQKKHLAKPIKRIPGLALPDGNHLLDGNPLPLHLFDFVLHLYHNWERPEALVFYVPKLENEEEAAYLKALIEYTEKAIQKLHPTYQLGTVRLFIVFENPRAIFRIQQMVLALSPYFLGGSLGWHDFLGSTARLFRYDPNYRIPVKADANIVINHIKESHRILVNSLLPFNAIKIGGMYGVLFEDGNPDSFEVCMVGYIKDVVTQLKRGLDGFWVAHPSFVRIGLALVAAWRLKEKDKADTSLEELVTVLVPNQSERLPLLDFIAGDDVSGLSTTDPLYLRAVLAAEMEESDVIANHDEKEVRYNIFQALQYLTDWLCGNGCVALPATLRNASGRDIFVRIMDDLATTERSRWELWAEVYHGRVSVAMFERLLREEVAFLRKDKSTATKRVQVKWHGEAARWYPIAVHILHQLVCDPDPVEFVPELLLAFTFDFVRQSDDPWAIVCSLCPGRYREFSV